MGKWGQGRPEPSALVDSLNPGRRDPSFWGICRPLKAGGSMQGGAGLLPGCLCLLPLPHPVFLATWHFGTSAWGGGFLTWGLASGGEVEKVGVRIGSGRHWRCSTRLPPPSPREPGKRLCLFKSLQAAGSRWPGRPGPLVLCVALHKRGGQLGRGRLQQVGGWGLASAPQQQQAPPGKGGGLCLGTHLLSAFCGSQGSPQTPLGHRSRSLPLGTWWPLPFTVPPTPGLE